MESVDVTSPPVEYIRKGVWLDCKSFYLYVYYRNAHGNTQ